MTTEALRQPKTIENGKAHIFVCTNKTELECLQRMLFGTNKLYAADVLSVKSGDLLFLLNVNSNLLHGIFRAKSDGRQNIVPEAWKGKYPYQVEVEPLGNVQGIENAKNTLQKLGIEWHKPLDVSMTKRLLTFFSSKEPEYIKQIAQNKQWGLLAPQKSKSSKALPLKVRQSANLK